MLGFIGREWRGEAPFWISAMLISLLLPWGLTLGGISWLSGYTMDHTPTGNIVAALVVFSLIGAVGVWQLVGTWRASAKARAPQRWWITRWATRLVAASSFALAAFAVSTMPAGVARYYAEATDADPIGQLGHELAVDGDAITVSGYLSWGLHDEFVEALKQNPGVRTVVLNSPGGHYAVGLRMGRMIGERGLDTATTQMCGSACTFAFLGGNRRILKSGAKLGYHAQSGNTDTIIAASERHAAGVMRAANVPEDFIAKAFATPPEDVWYPTVKELREANIVTDVVR